MKSRSIHERLDDLERRVYALETRGRSQPTLPGIAATPPTTAVSEDKKRTRSCRDALRRFTQEGRDLLMTAWDEVTDGRNVAENPVTLAEWKDAAAALDTAHELPNLIAFGDELRALLAERAGLRVKWSSQVSRSREAKGRG
jgi:hypothetical protein